MASEYRRPSGIYAVRLYIPERLQPYFHKREIHISTGSRRLQVAKIIASELKARWHRTLHLLSQMNPEKIKQFIPNLMGHGYISADEAAKLFESSPHRIVQMMCAGCVDFFLRSDGVQGWFIKDVDADLGLMVVDGVRETSIITDDLKERYSLCEPSAAMLSFYFPEDREGYALECNAKDLPVVLRNTTDNRVFVVHQYKKNISCSDIFFRRSDVENLRISLFDKIRSNLDLEAAPKASIQSTSLIVKDEVLTLSKVVEKYFLVNKSKKWKADQAERRENEGKILIDLLGDKPVNKIVRSDLRTFAEQIKEIPRSRNLVKAKYKLGEISLKELIAFAVKNDLEKLSAGEQKKILSGVFNIFEYAVNEHSIEKNPAAGLSAEIKVDSVVKEQDERFAFTQDILNQIFSLEWYKSGVGSKTKSGRFHEYSPYYYWLPLLGLYTGARLNELCQLHLSDFKQSERGTAFIEITIEDDNGNVVEDKSIKTKNSKRSLPLHQRLIDLGLIDYCTELKKAGHDRLFPELSHDARKGYGKAAGRWFNERLMGKQLQVPRDGRFTFHSFRHNYATALGQTSIKSTLKADLMGHQRSTALVELRYEKGVSPDSLKTYVNQIEFDLPDITKFKVQEGLIAVEHALKRKNK